MLPVLPLCCHHSPARIDMGETDASTGTDASGLSSWADGPCAPHLIVEIHSNDISKVRGHKTNVGGCGGLAPCRRRHHLGSIILSPDVIQLYRLPRLERDCHLSLTKSVLKEYVDELVHLGYRKYQPDDEIPDDARYFIVYPRSTPIARIGATGILVNRSGFSPRLVELYKLIDFGYYSQVLQTTTVSSKRGAEIIDYGFLQQDQTHGDTVKGINLPGITKYTDKINGPGDIGTCSDECGRTMLILSEIEREMCRLAGVEYQTIDATRISLFSKKLVCDSAAKSLGMDPSKQTFEMMSAGCSGHYRQTSSGASSKLVELKTHCDFGNDPTSTGCHYLSASCVMQRNASSIHRVNIGAYRKRVCQLAALKVESFRGLARELHNARDTTFANKWNISSSMLYTDGPDVKLMPACVDKNLLYSYYAHR